MKLLHVVGARPNFMKLAPVWLAARQRAGVEQVVVHTGQHYDHNMSGRFFQDLQIPTPDENLGVGSGSHASQTANIMLGFEPVLLRHRPDWVVVYGDVNSTLACGLVAAKLGVRVAHVEAGLRSRDPGMPEEINRILTDQLADLLLTPSRDAGSNLLAEGIPAERIVFVGNVMVDTLLRLRPKARDLDTPGRLGLPQGGYAFVTLHRPSNVDQPEVLRGLLDGLCDVADSIPVVFAIHPRTRSRIEEFGLGDQARRLQLLDPLGYLETISLVERAQMVITDSGGLQEETTVLGIPCLTVRENTERPVTITEGTNRLVTRDRRGIREGATAVMNGPGTKGRIPELWDGRTGERVLDALSAGAPA